ncbi:MAG: YdhK family protein [Bacillus sp. (in: firmicutes)]
MNKTWKAATLLFIAVLMLAACGDNNEETSPQEEESPAENTEQKENNSESGGGDEEHDHNDSDHVPAGLQEADNPLYEPDSKVKIKSGHMDGMEGAEATVKGAYDTVALAVDYIPEDGGEPVKNHKWVIVEEVDPIDNEELKPGSSVIISTDHMEGMQGATGEIVSAEQTTVYMVDYTSTTDGKEMKNHKWLIESELTPLN